MNFTDLPVFANLAVFAAAACGVWFSGSFLTVYAELIAERTGIGQAFAGVLLLGMATSLPELATTATASFGGNAALAGSNLLGGVPVQIAVLALVDATTMRGQALTIFSTQPALLMQGILLILLTALAAAAIVTGEPAGIAGIGTWSVSIAAVCVAVLYVIYRYETRPRWQPTGEVAEPPQSATDRKERHGRRYADRPTGRAWLLFGLSCLGVLAAGWLVAVTGEALAEQTGLGSGIIGATLVAFATSLPEISTTYTAVRSAAYAMAVGNIFGTNCLEVALLGFADVFYRDGFIYDTLDPTAGFLAVLGIVLTCVYLWGMLERRDKTILGMGVDSFLVLVLYIGGVGIYSVIAPR